MKRAGWGAAFVLLIVLGGLSPAALAAPATGHFTTYGALALPKQTNATIGGIGLILDDSSGLWGLSLEADVAEVCAFSLTAIHVALPDGDSYEASYDRKEACFPLSRLHLGLVMGNHSGWVGMRVDSLSSLVFQSSELHRTEARNFTRLSDPASKTAASKPRDSPQDAAFIQEVHGDHIFSEARGVLSYVGPGELKIMGPDVRADSATNSTTHRTGEEWGSGPVTTEGSISWLVVRFDSARVTLDSPGAPFQLAARHAQASTGALEFIASSGMLEVGGIVHTVPAGRPILLEGDLEAMLLPTPGSGGLLLDLSGSVQSVSFGGARFSPAPPEEPPFPWLVVVLGAIVMGGGVLLFGQQREPRLPPNLGDLRECAAICMEAGDYGRALTWIREARAVAPSDAALAADEARCLKEMGDPHGALKRLDEAHELSSEGSHALQAARLLWELDSPLELVVERLAAALDKTPTLLSEIEAEFPEASASPSWTGVVRLARLRSR